MRKHQLLFFADCESLVKKLDGLKNNPKKWSTTKAAGDIASNFFFVYDGFNKGIKINIVYTEANITLKSFVNA